MLGSKKWPLDYYLITGRPMLRVSAATPQSLFSFSRKVSNLYAYWACRWNVRVGALTRESPVIFKAPFV